MNLTDFNWNDLMFKYGGLTNHIADILPKTDLYNGFMNYVWYSIEDY